MSRLLVVLIVILVIVFGGLFVLANRATEQSQTRIEKPVELGNLAN